MRRLLILHLVCINLIAAAWIAVFIVHRRSVSSDTAPAEATGTARDHRAYPSVQVRVVSPPTGASDAPNYMVWLTGENPETGKFVARYGDLLGVGSVEELAAQVGSLPQPE